MCAPRPVRACLDGFAMTDNIQYALSPDGTHIAYRVLGASSEVDFIVVSAAFFSLEMLAEDRICSRFLEGLAEMGRVAVFDKRGVGSSDPMTDWSRGAQEQWADDLVAVMDAAGMVHPVVVSWETMGVARLAVSQHPDRFLKLVLINPSRDPNALLEALTMSRRDSSEDKASSEREFDTGPVEALAFPSRIHDPDFQEWLVKAGRVGASPSSAPRMWGHLLSYDKPLTPPGISAPALVLHNRDCIARRDLVLQVVDMLENAQFVSVPGADVYPIAGNVDPLIVEIAGFVGLDASPVPQRRICAVLFTDLVGSTSRASRDGDATWKALLEHHDQIIHRAVTQRSGAVIKFTGDGVLCVMPSVSAAIDLTIDLRRSLSEDDLDIRCGIHVGDVDERDGDVSGITVNIAARIMALAPDGQTLMSTAAIESAIGSGHRFETFGKRELKGVEGKWALHQLANSDDRPA